MKIVSKHRDYYDTVQAYGHDSHVTYCRATKRYDYSAYKKEWSVDRVKVRVPGELASLWAKAAELLPGKDYYHTWGRPTFSFSIFVIGGRIVPHVRSLLNAEVQGYFFDAPSTLAAMEDALVMVSHVYRKSKKSPREMVESFFALQGSELLMTAALEGAVVCCQVTPSSITIDPVLADFEVFRTLPPYQAAQHIEMFLGNLARSDQPPVAIADKYRITAHGFTAESFRNTGGRLKAVSKK